MNLSIEKPSVRLIGLCVFYVLYLIIGAAIFSAIEFQNEKNIIDNLKLKRQAFLTKHQKCLTGIKYDLRKNALLSVVVIRCNLKIFVYL